MRRTVDKMSNRGSIERNFGALKLIKNLQSSSKTALDTVLSGKSMPPVGDNKVVAASSG